MELPGGVWNFFFAARYEMRDKIPEADHVSPVTKLSSSWGTNVNKLEKIPLFGNPTWWPLGIPPGPTGPSYRSRMVVGWTYEVFASIPVDNRCPPDLGRPSS